MKKTSVFIYDLVMVVGVILFFFVITLLLIGERVLPDERTYAELDMQNYSEGWERVYKNGYRESIVLPGHFEPEQGQRFVIEKTIEGIDSGNTYVTLSTAKQDLYVYVGDELRYSYSTSCIPLFCRV